MLDAVCHINSEEPLIEVLEPASGTLNWREPVGPLEDMPPPLIYAQENSPIL
jgi:hypothetical protein